jgi:RNA polymerase sigma-70 factor (ECF subfamily)
MGSAVDYCEKNFIHRCKIWPVQVVFQVKGGICMSESLRTGDSFTSAVDKYSDTLIRISYTYLKNMSDSEDLVQEVFLKLFEKMPSFESREHEKAWLIRVTVNLCKNRLKTAWFRKTVPLDEEALGFTPEESSVMSTVLGLPSKYRSVVLLYYFEGYSIAEIADILGQKESTTGSQLDRARKLLKSKFKEDFDGE